MGDNSAIADRHNDARRILPLDTLRGLAILMVIGAHFWPSELFSSVPGAVAGSFGLGGVLLFFLLSGYLIYRNVQRQPLIVFLERRFFKLMPAYWVNVATVLALLFVLGDGASFSPGAFLANVLMVPDLTRMPLVNGVYWTLIIEIKFYVLIALQYRLLGDRMRLAVPAAIMACNFIFWIATGRGSTLLTYLPVFYIGIEIYCAEKDGWTRASCTRVALLVLLIAGSFDLFVSEQPVANIVFTLLDATVFIAVLTRGLELGMLSFFGRISYSLYLFHTTVGYPIVRGLPPSTYSPLLAAVLAVASSIVVAYVMFRCVETPGVQAGRGIEAYRMTGSSLRLPSGG